MKRYAVKEEGIDFVGVSSWCEWHPRRDEGTGTASTILDPRPYQLARRCDRSAKAVKRGIGRSKAARGKGGNSRSYTCLRPPQRASNWAVGRRSTCSRLEKRRLTEGALSVTRIISLAALQVSPIRTSARIQGDPAAAPTRVDLKAAAAWTNRPINSDAKAPLSQADWGLG